MINYTIDELMLRLGCKKYPERWKEIYSEAVSIYENKENPLLKAEYYDHLHKTYRVFQNTLDIYKKAATLIGQNEELSLFFVLLCRALKDRPTIQRDIAQMELPSPPEGADPLPYDMLTALSLCQAIPAFYEQLKAHNVSEEVMYASLQIPEKCVEMHAANGKPRLSSFDWYQHAYDGKLYRIGRLQLEFPMYCPGMYRVYESDSGSFIALANNMKIHRDGFALGSAHYEDEEGAYTAEITETDDAYIGYPYDSYGHVGKEKISLPKSQWKVKLSGGDKLVALHIPAGGGFENEAVEETLNMARKLLSEHYPEYDYKAFFCGSWLLDPLLVDILGDNSNISKFCKRFIPFGVKSSGRAIFGYVFKNHNSDINIAELPEDTRLRRALKELYLNDGAIYEMHGVFFDN